MTPPILGMFGWNLQVYLKITALLVLYRILIVFEIVILVMEQENIPVKTAKEQVWLVSFSIASLVC